MAELDEGAMRASDADRERVAERLRGALDEGRLNLAEYDDRLRQAYAATTVGELGPLTADLPAPAPATPPEVAEREEKLAKEWRSWAGVSFVLVAIWIVTSIASGGPLFFWPIIPMGIWAAVNVAGMIGGCGKQD
ncbi:DUF1707 SHOCT-like domain-containing protein [Saccharopolyspora griseoalba]|uniref:DUF1707 domain-containing protein n=1 Tax=Saccharopolyspora griseoalba TaxID=1431848 RepID=A0ABW2LSM8_9PSEU